MGAIIIGIMIVVAIMIINANKTGTAGEYTRLQAQGLQARGILLQVDSTVMATVGARNALVRYQRRRVRIDVEIPGREPYEVTATPLIPMNLVRDVVPGATVELRVDPKQPSRLAVIGPGVGFFGASLVGAPDQIQRSAS